MNETCEIGLIGLAVMGQNLVRNMARNGFKVAVYNRTASKTKAFVEAVPEKGITPGSVSYTHLDVYKRQAFCLRCPRNPTRGPCPPAQTR